MKTHQKLVEKPNFRYMSTLSAYDIMKYNEIVYGLHYFG